MGILIKFLIKSIRENRFRTFLILLSISLSVALFFASMAISKTVEDMIVEQVKVYIGTAEFMVYGNESMYFKEKNIASVENLFEYVIGANETALRYKDKENSTMDVSMMGIELEDLQKMNPFTLTMEKDVYPWAGKKVILGEVYAKEKGIQLGDNIKMSDGNDVKHMFKVVGLAKSTGYFKQPRNSKAAKFITPRDTVARMAGEKGSVSILYGRTTGIKNLKDSMEALKTVYTKHDVYETVSKEEIAKMSGQVRIPFLFMMILVAFISVFIIYTSFKVIMMERLPILGTFRSIGATQKMTNTIMLAETTVYGLIGGAAGVVLGIGALAAMVQVLIGMMGENMDVTPRVVYGIDDVLIAFLGAMFLSIISAIIPITKASRLPVKEILLNLMDGTKKKRKNVKLITSIVLAVVAVGILVAVPGKTGAMLGVVSIILIITSGILMVPYATHWIVGLAEGLFGKLFGNIGILAVKNIRSDKSHINNAILLTIGLSSIVTIAAMSDSTKGQILSSYDNNHYAIDGYISVSTPTTIQRIKAIDGVEEVFAYNSYNGFKYGEEDNPMIKSIMAFSDAKAHTYYKVDVLGTENDQTVLEELYKGRNLLVSTMIRDKYDLKAGQEVVLRFDRGEKEVKATYRILGFVKTNGDNTSVAYGSMRIIGGDLGKRSGSSYGVAVKPGFDAEAIAKTIKDSVKTDSYIEFKTVKQYKEDDLKNSGMIIGLLGAFAVITMLIGSIGVMNNYLVSFHSRKRSLAVFSSVGMSKRQTLTMIFVEAAAGGLLGGVFGTSMGFVIVTMLSSILIKAEIGSAFYLLPINIATGLLSAVLVSVLASISPARKSSKLSVVTELKYE